MDLLDNVLRNYPWGSRTAIQALLGAKPDGQPVAELWMGAHPDAPSRLRRSGGALDEAIRADPRSVLGARVVDRFGARLPFLLKVLAADRPLSLQVHPSEEQARAGYEAENAAGVPQDAPHRRYKDPHHKPEMICALTRFEALCGFRHPGEVLDVLEGLEVPGLDDVRARLRHPDPEVALREAFGYLLREGPRTGLPGRVARACAGRAAAGSAWAVEDATVVHLDTCYPGDAGVVVSLLLHRVTLEPGEALYLPAGNIHAYLEGTGIEIMACSDNVLRGGLTPKHVDVEELLRVVDFRPTAVPYVSRRSSGAVSSWFPGAAEFELHRVRLDGAPVDVPGTGPRVVLALDGETVLCGDAGGELRVRRGDAVLLGADDGGVTASGGDADLVVAAVPSQ